MTDTVCRYATIALALREVILSLGANKYKHDNKAFVAKPTGYL